MQNNKRKKVKKQVWLIAMLIFVLPLLYSMIKIFKWYGDNKDTEAQIAEIENMVTVEEVEENENEVETIEPPVEIDRENPYWDYIKMPLIQVNFQELKQKNNDTVGFIKVNNTNINYPVVQASDNSYYLTHSFDKSWNDAGWVFLDFRNNIENLGANTIIYAHSRLDKSMFGTLRNITTESWFNNKDNHVIYLSTPTENTMWQVFSVYRIPNETYYITTDFNTVSEHKTFLDTIVSRSKFNFNTPVSTLDKVLTLSTCYDDNNKTVLHAKLIKRQSR